MPQSQSSVPAREAHEASGRALMVETPRCPPSDGDQMSLPQMRMVLSLASAGPQTVKCLADSLKLHETAIEGLGAALVTRGLVVRIPNDSGAIVIALSTGGHRRVDDVISHDALAAARLPATQVLPTTR